MKTLYIIPSTGNNIAFYLVDIESQQIVNRHFCSNQWFAKNDLLDGRDDRIQALQKHYKDDVQCKFFNEQHKVSESVFFTIRGKIKAKLEWLNY